MPTLKLHYEGWVLLPAVLRQQLGLNSGDRLEVDLVDGTIVLRPAATTKRPAPRADQEAAIDSPAPAAPETLVLTDDVPARRKPERPRKHDLGAPTPKRPRGRPRAMRVPEPEPAPVRTVSSEPWKLRRKEDLQPQAASVEHAALPSPHPDRARSEVALAGGRAASVSQRRGAQAWSRTPAQQASSHFLVRPPAHLSDTPKPGSWPIALPPAGSSPLGSSQLLRLGVFIHAGYRVRTVPKLWPVGSSPAGLGPASLTQPRDEIAYVLEREQSTGHTPPDNSQHR